MEAGYRLGVEVEPLGNAEVDNGWTVLVRTIRPEVGGDTAILQTYQASNTIVESGFR